MLPDDVSVPYQSPIHSFHSGIDNATSTAALEGRRASAARDAPANNATSPGLTLDQDHWHLRIACVVPERGHLTAHETFMSWLLNLLATSHIWRLGQAGNPRPMRKKQNFQQARARISSESSKALAKC